MLRAPFPGSRGGTLHARCTGRQASSAAVTRVQELLSPGMETVRSGLRDEFGAFCRSTSKVVTNHAARDADAVGLLVSPASKVRTAAEVAVEAFHYAVDHAAAAGALPADLAELSQTGSQ